MRLTLDGRRAGRLECSKINLWYDYNDRTARSPQTESPVVATVSHGTEAELIERDGDGCLVEVEVDGETIQGWATYYFFKELKEEWNQRQVARSAR